ncbi:MAG TPA: dienelactone hydrolase family protein [Pseudolysinimonas sp.]|nr:dienelactone hydrolase family protein [Pseudolysinimonas sp.]
MVQLDPDAVLWSAPAAERDGRPLLVTMHGRGSDEQDLFALAPALPPQYVVAAVRAPLAEGAGWSWWQTVTSGDPEPERVDAAAAAVLTWLDALPFAPSLIGTLGFSQGGAMATHLLRREPGRFAFAVNLAGFAVRGEQPGDAMLALSRPPVFWGRGAADPLFSAEIVARTEPWLAAHTAAETHVYPGLGHSISREELDDVAAFLTSLVE